MANQNKKSGKGKWTRRAFIVTGGVVGTGLVVGVGGNMYITKKIQEYSGDGFGPGSSLNAWIRIAPDNTITLAVPRAEMGQGVYTSVPMLIAEELEVDMDKIKVIHPQPESPYANTFLLTNKSRDPWGGLTIMEKIASFLPVVGTGGSTTIADGYDHLRAVGASAREALISAAAESTGLDRNDFYAEDGHVINRKNNEKMTYGSLADAASKIELGKVPALKEQKDFKILGKPIRRLDIPEKVTGEAEFGIDVRRANMLYAAIRHPEFLGGTISSVNNQAEIEGMKGVKKVVALADGHGIVVIADNTWRAKNGAISLEVTEENGSESLNTQRISQTMRKIIADNDMIATPEKIGDVNAAFSNDQLKIVEAEYEVPYLAQATMEPLNCTALVEEDQATIWVGHQAPSVVRDKVAALTGIDKSRVTVNVTYLGGGFGRRAEVDFVTKATEAAMAMKGTPVQLAYSREEDMRYGMYRPAAMSQFKAGIDKNGNIAGWDNKMALQSVGNSSMMRILPSQAPAPKDDPMSSEGAAHLPYKMDSRQVAFGHLDVPIQVGNWRSVGSSQNGFFTESFIDECAEAAGQDPYLFRKGKLFDHPRFEAVLDKVAEMSSWSKPLPEGSYRGIALHKSFGSIVGQVAEVTKVGEKEIRIDKFYCVIDCGRIVNPDTVEAQMQSGIVFGLSAAMYGKITIKGGKIVEGNFPEYEMVRLNVAPDIKVHIMEIDEYPGGVGEPATPPAAPALANAIFAATGERVRSLPLIKHGYTFV